MLSYNINIKIKIGKIIMFKAIRYIGSKQKVLNFLEDNLFCLLNKGDKFFEGFAGTGIVSQFLAENKEDIIISGGDISVYSEIMFNILNIGIYNVSTELLNKFFTELDNTLLIEGICFNEFSENGSPETLSESRNFFHSETGKTIDTYRFLVKKYLENNLITQGQSKILLFYLLAYSCKMANTTSVFGAFLKSPPKYEKLSIDYVNNINKNLEKISKLRNESLFYLGDIVSNLKKIEKQNVIYLDPPYSTRRYETNYHILNFIMDLDFNKNQLKINSKTAQPIFLNKNPFGKKKETEIIFAEMILEGVNKSNYLAISYNTDGLIKQEWLENFCIINDLNLETKKMAYKRFKSKKEVKNIDSLEEILWIIQKK